MKRSLTGKEPPAVKEQQAGKQQQKRFDFDAECVPESVGLDQRWLWSVLAQYYEAPAQKTGLWTFLLFQSGNSWRLCSKPGAMDEREGKSIFMQVVDLVFS